MSAMAFGNNMIQIDNFMLIYYVQLTVYHLFSMVSLVSE
jgi:hypothetical protein